MERLRDDKDKEDDMIVVKQCAEYVLGALQKVNNDDKKEELKKE